MAKKLQKEYICPQCFRKQEFKDVGYICSNTNVKVNCKNARERNIIKFNKVVDKAVCDICKGAMLMVCPECGYSIPTSMKSNVNYPIAIIGAKEVGKSNYVAVLIQQLKNEIGHAFDFDMLADEQTIRRFASEFRDPLYKNKMCVRGSDAGDATPLIYTMQLPEKKKFFVKSEGENIILTFFDTAGENLDKMEMMQSHNRYLAHSSAIMLLLDPLQIPAVREQLEGKIRLPDIRTDVNDILDRVINIVSEESKLTKDGKLDIDIAIAFTKIDAVEPLLDPSSCLKNDSTHVRKGGFDKNDFEDENGEMQSLVSSWLGEELVTKVRKNFKNYAFFGVSALGSNPDLDNKIPKFRPFRVADPFLWILYQNGKINQV